MIISEYFDYQPIKLKKISKWYFNIIYTGFKIFGLYFSLFVL